MLNGKEASAREGCGSEGQRSDAESTLNEERLRRFNMHPLPISDPLRVGFAM